MLRGSSQVAELMQQYKLIRDKQLLDLGQDRQNATATQLMATVIVKKDPATKSGFRLEPCNR